MISSLNRGFSIRHIYTNVHDCSRKFWKSSISLFQFKLSYSLFKKLFNKRKLEIRLFKITQDVNDPVMNDYIQETIEQVFNQVDAIGTYGKTCLNWPSLTFSFWNQFNLGFVSEHKLNFIKGNPDVFRENCQFWTKYRFWQYYSSFLKEILIFDRMVIISSKSDYCGESRLNLK